MASTVITAREIKPVRFLAATNGKKVVMAITGAVLFLFVLAHMIGNMQIYAGPETFNAYGHFLHSIPELLWALRVLLIVCVLLHIWAAVVLAVRKSQARPIGYTTKRNTASTYASRTMYWSGPIILAFVIYHLLQLTAGVISPGGEYVEGDVYHNVVSGFQVWYVSAWYIFSMILLGLHLRHGVWSMFQSVGINHPRHTPVLKKAATIFAVVICGGFISIPVTIMLGVVK